MSKKSPFIPLTNIDFSGIAPTVTAVANANNVPTQVYPRTIEQAGQGASVTSLPLPERPMAAASVIEQATPASRYMLKVGLPPAVHAWVKQAADTGGCTKQYVLLEALRQAGAPVDLAKISKDGRRDR